ncbi:hypothetical protein [Variovorax sp. UMC13]|uniref:hypothetical protein n=1 Tax=Variovorax sp. UMC13 TaxID=1862326 RepID=UPI001600C378|nr:hypothetical protein [Variovorax sp. UMC13]MBB1604755.1 hypothetical protein [Variovorax sp. UMC13]
MDAPDALAQAILRALADAPARDGGGVSLPRLGKQLGLGASSLMRELSRMGDATLGGVPGPGWVRVAQQDDRWVVHLEAAGRALADTLPR